MSRRKSIGTAPSLAGVRDLKIGASLSGYRGGTQVSAANWIMGSEGPSPLVTEMDIPSNAKSRVGH